jgi:hypothetical protein
MVLFLTYLFVAPEGDEQCFFRQQGLDRRTEKGERERKGN